jgi:hypothetical protein
MNGKRILGLAIALHVSVAAASADSLELRNGSLIKGHFVGGTEISISFRVGSSVQNYDLADVRSLSFDSNGEGPPAVAPSQSAVPSIGARDEVAAASSFATISAGARISVRTIDAIDSSKNHVGDRFEASLEQPVWVDGKIVIPKGADVFGRLEESKATGTFTGKSELKLELTGIVVNGQTLPLVTGDYEVAGKSKSESTAKRSVGGAAVGSIIGALAGGGKGAAIGAGAGAGVGAGSETVTKGDQVKVPSETLLDFILQQSVSVPRGQ